MSFLQPWLLAALPLVALPIIIHLINQRRFQTIRWGAMMFLLAAQRMARGYSRLRQWLIMLFRMAIVAGLVLAVSRPLASGWVGSVAGGKADTTIILLDRSPSMQEQAAGGGQSKLETGIEQLTRILGTFSSARWMLIDSASREVHELESPAALRNAPQAAPASAPADLPLMLQAAHDYIKSQRTGRTEIWICSDLRSGDWLPDQGRWRALREAFLAFPQGVRFHLLAYPQVAASNVAVRVTSARRRLTREGAELLVSVRLSRAQGEEKLELPLRFEIDGSRSVLNVELTGLQVDVREHRIPLETGRQRGYGRVSIPADANAADNEHFFVFADQPSRRTLIIADDPQAAEPLQLAGSIAPDDSSSCVVELLTAEQLSGVAWDQISLVLWQSRLPSGAAADLLQSFVDQGGQVVFFPPREPDSTAFFGQRWESWSDVAAPVETWRGDADLLARTQSGAALPVGELEIHRHCGLQGELTNLALLRGGAPLLGRAASDRGGVYFWTTTPALRDSTLATNGIVLYAFIQRALATGAAALGNTRSVDAGNIATDDDSSWQRLLGGAEGLSTEASCHAGVYAIGERMLAINRPQSEDDRRLVPSVTITELFRGLDFTRVDDRPGNASSLIEEIWRAFLLLMLAAMIFEAALCLPKFARAPSAPALPTARAAA